MTKLIVNPGSTAVKYTLFDDVGAVIEAKNFSRKDVDHLTANEREWLASLSDVDEIGIRIVHGGAITQPTVISKDVFVEIEKATKYAPIHNTIALNAIDELSEVFNVPIVAVFDTAFHANMPIVAQTYPLQANLADELGLKRYGFHGIALQSALQKVNKIFTDDGKEIPAKVIFAHLGGGSSITAVLDGVSVDTTMGLTPLEGIMMTTRSGTIGSDVARIIGEEKFLSPQDVSKILNEQSGFYGLTGTKDTEEIVNKALDGEAPYKQAFDLFVYQIVKQIYAYYGVLQGVDAIVFSGGIGFGNADLRDAVLSKLGLIGVDVSKVFAVDVDEASMIFDALK